MGAITLYTTAEYEPQAFDAVLVRDEIVVGVRKRDDEDGDDLVRVVPLEKVNRIDGEADTLLVDTEIPETFYGGSDYGFVDTAQFPDIQEHLTDLADETY